jgi:hypothetical protein
VDEIFKANSAILNSLLTVLNERRFDNGNIRQEIPLFAVVGASNELPDSEELVRCLILILSCLVVSCCFSYVFRFNRITLYPFSTILVPRSARVLP